MGAFIKNEETIMLGKHEVTVSERPIPRIKKFQEVWNEVFTRFDTVQEVFSKLDTEGETVTPESVFEEVFRFAIDMPKKLLEIAIPDLPADVFEDEEDGVTIPQLMHAFEVVIRVNRLEWLQKLTPFFQTMIRTINPAPLQAIDAMTRTGSTPASS